MSKTDGSMDVRTLVDQHYEMLYRFAYRLSGSAAEAEDLTQDTFCTAQEKIAQLRDPASARGWLCRILRNHFLMSRRKQLETSIESLDELAVEPAAAEDGPRDIDAHRVQEVLRELPEPFRTPVILFYFEEFSYRQIAEQLGVPIGTVMSRLARAKTYLRAHLQATCVAVHANPSVPGVT